MTDANFETSSYDEYADGYLLSKNMVKWFWDNYIAELAQRREVYVSPLQASTEQLKGLPPAYIQVAGNDVLRDEGVAYARKLDAAGVEVTLVSYDGMIHDFGCLNYLSRIPAVRTALHQAAEELKRYLK
jgi:acetyl esterase/lipase